MLKIDPHFSTTIWQIVGNTVDQPFRAVLQCQYEACEYCFVDRRRLARVDQVAVHIVQDVSVATPQVFCSGECVAGNFSRLSILRLLKIAADGMP
ncbi:Unknown protein sequence [Pseudomonas syringae pv. maculicola]|nr:Unknown protein sequence [Pseudomonas syringae pv. maculicola]